MSTRWCEKSCKKKDDVKNYKDVIFNLLNTTLIIF